jgi:hypothetical protein
MADHVSGGAAQCALARSLSIATADSERRSQDDREAPDQTRQSMSQPAAPSAVNAGVQRDDEVHEADAVNDKAVAAYWRSVQAGNPLSERKLARMFGRTSRRWARARIAAARQLSQEPLRGRANLDHPGEAANIQHEGQASLCLESAQELQDK